MQPYQPPKSLDIAEPESVSQRLGYFGMIFNRLLFWATTLVIYLAIVPEFADLFEEFGLDLPELTLLMMSWADRQFVLIAAVSCLLVLDVGVYLGLNKPETRSLAVVWAYLTMLMWLMLIGLTLLALVMPLISLTSLISDLADAK